MNAPMSRRRVLWIASWLLSLATLGACKHQTVVTSAGGDTDYVPEPQTQPVESDGDGDDGAGGGGGM